MAAGDQIQYVDQQKIDKVKWDACIDKAPNGLIYAYSFYLDTMAKHWDALVLNDYEAVMPLVWNKKYGFYYLYLPPFTGMLGVFGKNVSNQLTEEFLTHIPKRFKLQDHALNFHFIPSGEAYTIKIRNNYVLSLKPKYDTLLAQFRPSYKQLIKKSEEAGLVIKTSIPVKDVLDLSKRNLLQKTSMTEEDLLRLEQVFYEVQKNLKAVTYGVYSSDERLLASAIFFFSHNRAYYILAGNTEQGRNAGALHYLLNHFIKDNAGQDLLLDFEGSDIPGIAFFFEGFGAKKEPYSALRINNLPWYLRWTK